MRLDRIVDEYRHTIEFQGRQVSRTVPWAGYIPRNHAGYSFGGYFRIVRGHQMNDPTQASAADSLATTVIDLQRENAALRERLREQNDWIAKSVGELSSYAFNNYGGDAKLYNGIHALELGMAKAQECLAEAEADRDAAVEAIRMACVISRPCNCENCEKRFFAVLAKADAARSAAKPAEKIP